MQFLFAHVLPYVAVATFSIGVGWRTWSWLRKPVPFPLTLDATSHGRAAGIAKELGLFASLYKSDRLLWLAAWSMHAALALIVFGHLVGIALLAEQFTYLGASAAISRFLSGVLGTGAGLVFVAALLGLSLRRTVIPEVKHLSDPADFFDLRLLAAIAVSGLCLRFPAAGVDLESVRSYLIGLLTFRPAPFPPGWIFAVHFTLVNGLLFYFPFSKLIHVTSAIVCRALLVEAPPIYPTPDNVAAGVPFLKSQGNDSP